MNEKSRNDSPAPQVSDKSCPRVHSSDDKTVLLECPGRRKFILHISAVYESGCDFIIRKFPPDLAFFCIRSKGEDFSNTASHVHTFQKILSLKYDFELIKLQTYIADTAIGMNLVILLESY